MVAKQDMETAMDDLSDFLARSKAFQQDLDQIAGVPWLVIYDLSQISGRNGRIANVGIFKAQTAERALNLAVNAWHLEWLPKGDRTARLRALDLNALLLIGSWSYMDLPDPQDL